MTLDSDSLEALRMLGDERADAVVADLFEHHTLEAVNALLHRLVAVDDLPPEALPASVRDYFADTLEGAVLSPVEREAAEALFSACGPEVLLGLGAYSLPMCYAVGRAAPVLVRTARLVDGTRRRVFETTQFVVDCFGPGGLGPHGRGFRSAQKVRLMHAAVRRLLVSDPLEPWDMALGLPINQVDMAYTLHTFDGVVLDGLSRLGIDVPAESADAWHACWLAVGHVLGVDARFLHADRHAADAQGATLAAALHSPSEAGIELTAALVKMFQEMIPGEVFDGLTPAILRHYLGADLVAMLGVPEGRRMNRVWRMVLGQARPVFDTADEPTATGAMLRRFNLAFIDALVLMGRGGRRAPFAVPVALADGWRAG